MKTTRRLLVAVSAAAALAAGPSLAVASGAPLHQVGSRVAPLPVANDPSSPDRAAPDSPDCGGGRFAADCSAPTRTPVAVPAPAHRALLDGLEQASAAAGSSPAAGGGTASTPGSVAPPAAAAALAADL